MPETTPVPDNSDIESNKAFAINVVGTVIPIIGWFIILPLGLLMILVWAIMGIIGAVNGQMKKLWLIGGFTILK